MNKAVARACAVAGGIVAGLVVPFSSQAAEIQTERLDSGAVMISLNGDIEAGDLAKFRRVALEADRAVVVLASDGGATLEAIEIGRIVRLKGYATVVIGGQRCVSACGLVWVAGEKRYLSPDAKVGFHASYIEQSGEQRESGVGNAVVGSYLSSLGLGQRAVVFATSAPPDRVNWLTLENAATSGIEVSKFGESVERSQHSDNDISSNGEARIYSHVGKWTVAVDESLGNGCFVLARYDDVAFRLGFDMRDPADGYLMLLGSAWKAIEVDREYPLALAFGSEAPWQAKAKGTKMGETRGLIVKFDKKAFFDEFGRNETFRVLYRERQIELLSIKDSAVALQTLRQCQRHENSADPFAR